MNLSPSPTPTLNRSSKSRSLSLLDYPDSETIISIINLRIQSNLREVRTAALKSLAANSSLPLLNAQFDVLFQEFRKTIETSPAPDASDNVKTACLYLKELMEAVQYKRSVYNETREGGEWKPEMVDVTRQMVSVLCLLCEVEVKLAEERGGEKERDKERRVRVRKLVEKLAALHGLVVRRMRIGNGDVREDLEVRDW